MEYSENTLLRPVVYNPNENISNSARTSRATSTYSISIKYAPSITSDSISYSRPQSTHVYNRPVSELYRNKGVLRTPTKDMVSQVLPSRPRHIPSAIPSPLASGNLPLFENTAQVANRPLGQAPRPSNLSTPNTMSPLFPPSPSITTQYTTPNRSPLVRTPSQVMVQPAKMCRDVNVLESKALSQPSNINSINSVHSIDTNEEFRNRRRKIREGIITELNRGYSSKEVVIAKPGIFSKIKLGFKSLDSNLNSIYIKYDS